MQSTDIEVIKEIPGYKVILKAVLKSQIQQMVEQLADHTGEESVILTASVSDGSLSHLGSESGKVFLEDHEDIKSQFLGFCLKRHHTQKQNENQQQQHRVFSNAARNVEGIPTLTRMGPGKRQRFASAHHSPAPSMQMPLQFENSLNYSTSSTDIHPVALTRSQPQTVAEESMHNVRHEPHPLKRPRKRQGKSSQGSSSMKLPTETEKVTNTDEILADVSVKMEVNDDLFESQDSHGSGKLENSKTSGDKNYNHNQKLSFRDSSLTFHESSVSKGDDSNTSASTIENNALADREAIHSDTSRIDPSSLPVAYTSDQVDNSDSGSQREISEIDSASDIKIEPITESELELEITGVEPGHMTIPDTKWSSEIPSGITDAPPLSGKGRRASTGSSRTKDYDMVGSGNLVAKPLEGSSLETGSGSSVQVPVPSTLTSSVRSSHACSVCGKTFQSRDALVKHCKKHTRQFMCRKCTQAFQSQESLESHNMQKHTMEFLCTVCGKTLRGKRSFQSHLSIHEGKHLQCPFQDCQKTFLTQKTLTDHINVHTKLKPYSCNTCDTNFSRAASLSRHKMACQTGLICPTCGRTFNSASSLTDHKQTEHLKLPFVCRCGRRFKWRPNLSRHKKKCNNAT